MSGGEGAPPYPAAASHRLSRTLYNGVKSTSRPCTRLSRDIHLSGRKSAALPAAGGSLPSPWAPPPTAQRCPGLPSTLLCCLLPALPAPNLTACCLQPPPRLLTGWDGTPHTAQRHPDPHPHPRHPRRTWSSCQGWGRGSLRVGSVWGLPPAVPCCPRSRRDKRSLKYILACILASVMQGTVVSLRLRILKTWRPRT